MVSGTLNEHVERPPASEGPHAKQSTAVDPAYLLEDLGEGHDTRADGGASHSKNTAAQASFLHLAEEALSEWALLLVEHSYIGI